MDISITEKPQVVSRLDLNTDLTNSVKTIENTSPELDSQANEILSRLLSIGEKDLSEQRKFGTAIRNFGKPVQNKLAQRSLLLKAPIKSLVDDAEDGGKVANDLLRLQEQVNQINPNKIDFTTGTIRRLLSKLPGMGTPISRWFAKYQVVNAVIDDIVGSLKDGKAQLDRDNNILNDDQDRLRQTTFELQDFITLGQLIDKKLTTQIEAKPDSPMRKFLEEELAFPLKQRIIDLQQQLAVNQQGVLATEVIIRNNRQLILGVDRTLNVTIAALTTASTLQIALQRQKKVLKGVQAVNDTTNELITSTAEQLKTQGVAVQKEASKASLDISSLKQAFSDMETALNDISTFRREALPEMAASILEMDEITQAMENSIKEMEQGNKAEEDFNFQIGK